MRWQLSWAGCPEPNVNLLLFTPCLDDQPNTGGTIDPVTAGIRQPAGASRIGALGDGEPGGGSGRAPPDPMPRRSASCAETNGSQGRARLHEEAGLGEEPPCSCVAGEGCLQRWITLWAVGRATTPRTTCRGAVGALRPMQSAHFSADSAVDGKRRRGIVRARRALGVRGRRGGPAIRVM